MYGKENHMNTIVSRPSVIGLLFLLTLISGVWLSHLGKPYNTWIFTLHKLIAVATIIVVGINGYYLYRALGTQTLVELAIIAASGLIFLALIVTGALLSLNIPLRGAALKIHQVAPLLALASSSITVYLLASGGS
jgi:hypothetical protein